MGAPSNLSRILSQGETWRTVAVFDVAANGAMTLKYGKGVASITETAQGKHTITFTDVGGYPLMANCRVKQAAGTAALVVNECVDAFSQSAKTLTVEIWDLATPALARPPSGSDFVVEVTWLKSL